ncbi:SEFIR domain-containing protein [Chryseobacterium taichungense]|uniref:SEFIR domain-containing protein n=1 Tax=Chryseobacterium taichungense TaxID=295069 RepID=A0A1H8ABJ7_9FLAO|nr:toll/interleukin-1 receptor domain-containing protein [Chryseobacterium taichungense]SEM67923.1 SEFIR domain-containing protein [Chryseobacterium taichungense]
METKKVFISYSWGLQEHQEKVREIGTRLMSDGIDVILDQWSLKDGHDLNFFMESIVNDNTINKVLIISDKNYSLKADGRKGGVGTEAQILTPEIYGNTQQEKFIPIVFERDEENKPYLPTFLKSRKYIDLSTEEYYEEEYENLVRNILDAPQIRKPKLGTIPSFITEEKQHDSKTYFQLKSLDNQLNKNPLKVDSLTNDFLSIFLDNLWNFQLVNTPRSIGEFGELLINNLSSYREMRNDYIEFLLKVTKNEYNLDVERLISFFEKSSLYKKPRDFGENIRSYYEADFENFKIIFQELFLYTIAIAYKNNNYNLVSDLLNSGYYFSDVTGRNTELEKFYQLYSHNQNLENYYKELENKITGFGHYVITNLNSNISKMEIIFADTLNHYISELQSKNYKKWFPTTYLYKDEYRDFDFFIKLTSKRFFDKVKGIFNVEDVESFKALISNYQQVVEKENRSRPTYGNWHSIPFIFEAVKINKVATER